MIQVSICVTKDQAEVEKQINNFFKINKDKVKYVDIKYIVHDDGYTYAMIVYDTIEEDKNTLKL
jgi:hypothetical protein